MPLIWQLQEQYIICFCFIVAIFFFFFMIFLSVFTARKICTIHRFQWIILVIRDLVQLLIMCNHCMYSCKSKTTMTTTCCYSLHRFLSRYCWLCRCYCSSAVQRNTEEKQNWFLQPDLKISILFSFHAESKNYSNYRQIEMNSYDSLRLIALYKWFRFHFKPITSTYSLSLIIWQSVRCFDTTKY